MAQRRSARLRGAATAIEDASAPVEMARRPVAPPNKARGKTVSFDKLPAWQRDNESILTGYRLEMRHWPSVWRSAYAYLHNETVNIWTHAVGAVVALTCLIAVFGFGRPPPTTDDPLYLRAPFGLVNPLPHPAQPSVTWVDAAMHACFFLSATFTLASSSLFHCVNCHSEPVAKRFNRLDYIAIVVLIVGSFYPAVYYGFYCHRSLQHLYIAAITLAGAAAMYTVVAPTWRTPAYRRARTYVFISLGASAVFPIVHALLLYGWRHSNEVFSMRYLVLEGALYVGGALLYAERVPERFSPGTFDLFGASHQIFHVMIDLAAMAHYKAIADAFRHRHGALRGVCD